MRAFNCLTHRWRNIEPEANKSMQDAGFVCITRPVTLSGLRKGRGSMITSQSIKPEQLPESVRGIAEDIVKNYSIKEMG